MRVAVYNLHGETLGWGPRHFEAHDYTAELAALAADTYVLPEVWAEPDKQPQRSTVVEWLERSEFNWVSARASTSTPRKPKLGEVRDAHVVVATRHPITETHEFLFPRHPRDTSTSRSCVAARIETPDSGEIWVVGVHLSANVPWAPRDNITHLRGFVGALRGDAPVVVAGDFNFWGWGVRPTLRGGLRRAVTGRTWPATNPHSQIDHILHSSELVSQHSSVAPLGSSDHRAVAASIEMNRPEN